MFHPQEKQEIILKYCKGISKEVAASSGGIAMGNIKKVRREIFNEYTNGIELVQNGAHMNTTLQ
jgi:hypothetical protein